MPAYLLRHPPHRRAHSAKILRPSLGAWWRPHIESQCLEVCAVLPLTGHTSAPSLAATAPTEAAENRVKVFNFSPPGGRGAIESQQNLSIPSASQCLEVCAVLPLTGHTSPPSLVVTAPTMATESEGEVFRPLSPRGRIRGRKVKNFYPVFCDLRWSCRNQTWWGGVPCQRQHRAHVQTL